MQKYVLGVLSNQLKEKMKRYYGILSITRFLNCESGSPAHLNLGILFLSQQFFLTFY